LQAGVVLASEVDMDEWANRTLAEQNRRRFAPGDTDASSDDDIASLALEADFLAEELIHVRDQAAQAPRDAGAFVRWFSALETEGPGQRDPLFDWLAEAATRPQMRWFLVQETAGEAGFDDLVALTQVRLPERAKLELARNYWDEMGQGRASAMHGPMLARLAKELDIGPCDEVVWESLALANLMVGLATRRQHAYRALGALGVVELTAPWRAARVNEGLRRLGFDGEARRYYALHATLDVKHSEAWNREVIGPLVLERPELAQPIAEGALARLVAGARCFDRYKRALFT
jgi:Iron-containing redox enzyme